MAGTQVVELYFGSGCRKVLHIQKYWTFYDYVAMGKFSVLLTLIIEVWIYIPNARSVATRRTSNMFLETILQLLDYGVNFWFQGRRAHLSMPLSLLWYRQIVELMSLIPATSHESSYFVWQFGCYGKKGTKSCSSIVTLNTIYKKNCIQRHANIVLQQPK